MRIPFDLIIKNPPNYSVDMKLSLKTMDGISDAIRTISDTIVDGTVPQRKTHKSSMRTNLEQSFIGSYGQNFSLVTYNSVAKEKIESIGESVLIELIKYYLAEALFQDYPKLSSPAEKCLNELGKTSNLLIKNLRDGSLQNAHSISKILDYDVILNYKSQKGSVDEIQFFNKETYSVLTQKKEKKIREISIAVTRLNIFTGNGRCRVKGMHSVNTIAFGFISYKFLDQARKKSFSKNLDMNNGLQDEEALTYIDVHARALIKQDGEVVKYIIESVLNEE